MGTIITNDIVGCWDASTSRSYPGSGTTWKNLAGSADATMSGATYNSFNNGCIYYDGSSVVTIADADLEVSGPFTFSIWVYFTDASINYTVFSLRGGTGWDDDEFAISMLNESWQSHSLRLGCKGHDTDGVTMNKYTADTYGPENNLNVWRNYLAVYDGVDRKAASSFKLYFDGVYQAPNTTYSWSAAYNGTSWGRDGHSGTSGRFKGYLGPVLLYNKALTASEVRENYYAQRGRFTI